MLFVLKRSDHVLTDDTSNGNSDKPYCGRPMTAAQMLEDKRLMVEAINSGRMSLLDESLLPPRLDEPAPQQQPAPADDGFEPCIFFFYGTLMDPEVLRSVAALDAPPELADAWVEGLELRLWHAVYPTLTRLRQARAATPRVDGKAWRATSMDQCLRLQRYETAAYEGYDCDVYLAAGAVVRGLTFVWAGDPDSSQLSDGTFNLALWQRNHKGSVF
ncbi:gamma-glutamyl cyclotransferase, AIG2-like domain-containing protein [Hirsutella rhossiliensis]|uniref:Putative gamma-glutamylcyclotransferase n=1 Tax=Hirsutella rhossiliensis TaxID=111463 RepID=A0A9P8SP40_9HYPO|nr:gamma-glutamyl cyclotransferase, AIG2-like domain-containing protein [Hirsutella rhossiliensis]KAH0967806.1 gamma-glutamyl cyclotransferase, AIG2-like domain-containing protein [Hirsutella rhossiliensis]